MQARPLRPQAKVCVVRHNAVTLVEPAQLFEGPTPDKQTGACHRQHVSLAQRDPKWARLVSRRKAKGMPEPRAGEKHARMLNPAVRVEELRADDADLRALRMTDQDA